jgi:peptide subunit release factor 1 (eRF1)
VVIVPPKPIKKLEYRCDKVFHTQALLQLYDPPELCGLIFINGENCQLFTVDVSTNDKTKSGHANTRLKQHKKGGQSSARFGRLHDEKVVRYLKEIAEEAREAFAELPYVIVAGISKRPDELMQHVHIELEQKIIGTIVMTDFDNTIVPKMLDLVTKQKIDRETQLLADFAHALENDKAVYGPDEIAEAITQSQLSVLYASNQFDANNADGIQIIRIGISLKAQELISIYGQAFGIKWW